MEERSRYLDPQGVDNLIQAIVDCAINDFMHAPPSSEYRRDAERFFLSEWFEQLTGFNGKDVLKKLQADYDRKHKKHNGGRKQ